VFNRRNTLSILRIGHLVPTKDLSPKRVFNTASYALLCGSAGTTPFITSNPSIFTQYYRYRYPFFTQIIYNVHINNVREIGFKQKELKEYER
jgi:hypothetical protein